MLRDIKHIGVRPLPPSHTFTLLRGHNVPGNQIISAPSPPHHAHVLSCLRFPTTTHHSTHFARLVLGESVASSIFRDALATLTCYQVSTVVTTTHHSTHFARLVLGHVASSPSDRGAELLVRGIRDTHDPAPAHAGTRENKTCGGATKTGPTSFPRVAPAPAPALMILSLSPRMHVNPRVPEIPSMVLFLGPRKER
jgi:hypothetical protein